MVSAAWSTSCTDTAGSTSAGTTIAGPPLPASRCGGERRRCPGRLAGRRLNGAGAAPGETDEPYVWASTVAVRKPGGSSAMGTAARCRSVLSSASTRPRQRTTAYRRSPRRDRRRPHQRRAGVTGGRSINGHRRRCLAASRRHLSSESIETLRRDTGQWHTDHDGTHDLREQAVSAGPPSTSKNSHTAADM